MPGLPPALDGLSLLHLSDLHFAPCFDRRFFEAVADEAASLGGGPRRLHRRPRRPRRRRSTGSCPSSRGSGAGSGRSRSWATTTSSTTPPGSAGCSARPGSPTWRRRWATVDVGGARRWRWGGRRTPGGRRSRSADRPRPTSGILLSHSPDLFYWAERAGFDLMLSGHNHGGQIRLPLVGAGLHAEPSTRGGSTGASSARTA